MLVAEDARNAEIIRRWIRGRNIGRWQVQWAGQYLVWTHQDVDIKRYPAVIKYLSESRDALGKRWEPRHGQCKWYELRPCDYYAGFEKPKVVWAKYGIEPAFTYDTENYFYGNTAFFFPTEDLMLVGILNSKLIQWYATHTFNVVRGGYIEWIPTNVARIPILTGTASQNSAIEGLVRKLLDAEGQGPLVASWERDLNALVYELYGLTDEEIAIVEGGA